MCGGASGSWECSEVGDACPSILLPPPFIWRPERSLVMEDVSACDLLFKPGLGGEGKPIWNWEKLNSCSKLQNCLKI